MHVRIRRGLDIPISGAPERRIEDANPVGWVALVAMDFVGLQPRLKVDVGHRVRLGQPLLIDKNNPEVMFTSPGCGEIVAIHRGARRSLQSVVVRLDGVEQEIFPSHERTELTQLDRDAVRAVLQSSGLWTSLRARPFGKVPNADASPHSIFVTAVDTNPLAGDPRLIIADRAQEFHDGVAVLSRLTEGKVHVCQSPGHGFELPNLASVSSATFEGPHPAGLPGLDGSHRC